MSKNLKEQKRLENLLNEGYTEKQANELIKEDKNAGIGVNAETIEDAKKAIKALSEAYAYDYLDAADASDDIKEIEKVLNGSVSFEDFIKKIELVKDVNTGKYRW